MTRTHCPACAAKLPERSREMSNCLYCGFPFEFSEANDDQVAPLSPYLARIQRVLEHDEYQDSIAWEPPPGLEHHRVRQARLRGWVLALVGAALAIWSGSRATPAWLGVGLGAALCVTGIVLVVQAQRALAAFLRWPILRRACAIVDRRSETQAVGLAGRTDYHFLLEFEDGNRAEFRWQGRGTSQEPLSTGITGVAYTRGKTFVTFRQIRT